MQKGRHFVRKIRQVTQHTHIPACTQASPRNRSRVISPPSCIFYQANHQIPSPAPAFQDAAEDGRHIPTSRRAHTTPTTKQEAADQCGHPRCGRHGRLQGRHLFCSNDPSSRNQLFSPTPGSHQSQRQQPHSEPANDPTGHLSFTPLA
jgi:hypothetical protein